jgi:hypothetical protein
MGSTYSIQASAVIKLPMANPLSVYVPIESLSEATVRSIISVATSFSFPNWDYSERTLLIFLLAINEKLKEIETNVNENDKKIDEPSVQRAQEIRRWLVDRQNKPLNWEHLKQKYDQIAGKNCDDLAKYHGHKGADPYFELILKTVSDS